MKAYQLAGGIGVAFAVALAVIPAVICCIPPTKPAASPVTAEDVYWRLVDGGCLANDPVGGIDFIAAEHTLPDESPYLKCLWDGGTLQSCKVPCK